MSEQELSLTHPFTRRQILRAAGALSVVSVLGPLGVAACASASSAVPATATAANSPATKGPIASGGSGIAGANGINPADYVGGDGSYERYAQNGIRLGYEPNPGNLDNPLPGKRSGWNTDLVLEALTRVGITKYTYAGGPWDSLVPGLQSSRFDLLMSDVHVTAERVKIIDFTTPIYWYGEILVVPKGNRANLHSWAGLAGHTIGVVRGYDMAELLQKRTDLKALQQYPDDISLALDVAAGRLDGEIAGDPNFVGMMLQNPGLELEIVPDYKAVSDPTGWTRYSVRKGENDLNNVLSHAFGEMFIDGTTLGILQAYGMGTRNLFVIKGM